MKVVMQNFVMLDVVMLDAFMLSGMGLNIKVPVSDTG
jgi:hypothetical protein